MSVCRSHVVLHVFVMSVINRHDGLFPRKLPRKREQMLGRSLMFACICLKKARGMLMPLKR